jgi:hypothetical protein
MSHYTGLRNFIVNDERRERLLRIAVVQPQLGLFSGRVQWRGEGGYKSDAISTTTLAVCVCPRHTLVSSFFFLVGRRRRRYWKSPHFLFGLLLLLMPEPQVTWAAQFPLTHECVDAVYIRRPFIYSGSSSYTCWQTPRPYSIPFCCRAIHTNTLNMWIYRFKETVYRNGYVVYIYMGG